MADKKQKNYVRISDYGDLLVPIDMLDRLVTEGRIVRTTYNNDVDEISEITEISRVHLHTSADIEAAKVQIALQGKENEQTV
jgi:hypothetical protein